MFHVPFRLREPKGLVVPKGPNFKRARKLTRTLGGTLLSFTLPKHSAIRSNDKPVIPSKEYRPIYREAFSPEDFERGLTDHWRKAEYLYHSWAFNGPWFTGAVAELECRMSIIKVINYPDGMSLFHPRALEAVIGDYITFMQGDHLDFTRQYVQEFEAPLNWQPLTHLPVNAVRFKVVSQGFSPFRTKKHWVLFPISDNLLVSVLFRPSRLKNLPREILDERVDEKPMLELMDSIINSIEVELSPEAQAQQEKALAGMEDVSLVKEYPLLKWDNLDPIEKAELLERENAKALKYYRDLLADYEAQGKQYAR